MSTRPINEKRTTSFRRKSVGDLTKIADSGSLGAAAAKFELNRRGAGAGAEVEEDQ